MPGIQENPRQIPRINVILNGQGDGAALLFDKVIERHNIVGVVATINKTSEGRPDPLRQKAKDAGIPVINLGNISDRNKPDNPKFLQAKRDMRVMNADLSVGFFLQAGLPRDVYSIPEFGTMNFHLSHMRRGRDAMNRGIMDGDKELGAEMYLMNGLIDAGPIVKQMSYENPGDKSQGALYHAHLNEYIQLAVDATDDMAIGIYKRRESGGKAKLPVTARTYPLPPDEPRLTETDMEIDFEGMDAEQIKRLMLAGGLGAWTLIDGEKVRLSRPTVIQGPNLNHGRMADVSEQGILFEAKNGLILAGRSQKA